MASKPPNKPVLRFSTAGKLLDDNFVEKPSIPMSNPHCIPSTNSGIRGEGFTSCFTKRLLSEAQPTFAGSNAASGNSKKMDALCAKAELAPHQLAVSEMAKLMAAIPVEQLGEHRGLLVWHGTGTGKTVSSLAIIMAFWPSDKRIVLVSTKSNTNQAIQSYKREAPRFFPEMVKLISADYKKRKGGGGAMSETDAFNAALSERVQGLTFVEARNRIAASKAEFKTVKAIPLHEGSGSVLIIDEAQGLAMTSRTDPKGDAIKLGCALRSLSPEKMRKIRVFAMTATPGNSIKQWLRLLSVVRRADQRPFVDDDDVGSDAKGRQLCNTNANTNTASSKKSEKTSEKLAKILRDALSKNTPLSAVIQYVQKHLSGLVSYVDIRSDLARFACVREVTMNIPMEKYYFLIMLRVNAQERLKASSSKSNIAQQRYDASKPDFYLKRMRNLGHSLPKTVWSVLPRNVQEELARRKRILQIDARSDGRWVSPKFIMLAQWLGEKPEKQYCYTVSGNEYVLATALRKWYGIKDVTRKAETFDGAHYNKNKGKVEGLSKGRHLIVLNDATTKEHRERLVGIFNSDENMRGDYISIVIASGQLYEGLDLTGLRYVHIAEPMVTALHEIQAVGRGARNCSHRGLPLAERRVEIVRWQNVVPPGSWNDLQNLATSLRGLRGKITESSLKKEYERLGGKSYDELVFQRARLDPEYITLTNWESIVQAFAIDCNILQRYHPHVKCSQPRLSKQIVISSGSRCSNTSK
jgi:hypothetical protein